MPSNINSYTNCGKVKQDILYITRNEYNFFLKKANVVAVGLGYKEIKKIKLKEYCIKVFVTKKYAKNELNMEDLIPEIYKGYKTDVVETGGIPHATTLRDRVRPVTGGYSISIANSILGGSYGCLVTDGRGTLYILSNNHVIAQNSYPIGTPIVQPSAQYGGKVPEDIVANLSDYIPILYRTPTSEPENLVDCAIAEGIHVNILSSIITEIGIPKGVNIAKIDDLVRKTGEATELTYGLVEAIGVSVIIQYITGRQALFVDQFATTKMIRPGDSGAAIINRNDEVVGLVMSETPQYDYNNNIHHILNSLRVKIVVS